MATAFGLDVDQAGNGTTPDDIQRILGAQWRTAGIVSGCAVTGMSEAAYNVFAGAVVMDWGKDQKIMVPVVATKVPTTANPGTTARTDRVYVQQRTVSADGDNLAVVKVTQGSLPARSILLAEYKVPAGATDTKGAVDQANRIFTRPVGGQYGQVAKSIDMDTTTHAGELIKRGQVNLWFGAMWAGVAPTDRDLMVHFNSCISAAGETQGEGSVIYKFYLNGTLAYAVERVWNKYWNSEHFAFPIVIQKDFNTMYYTVQRRSGTGTWAVRYGGSEKFPGDQMWVIDNGVANL